MKDGSEPSIAILSIEKRPGSCAITSNRAVADPTFVMIDLEFDSTADVERMLDKLRHLWTGPGGSMMRDPHAWILETVESRPE